MPNKLIEKIRDYLKSIGLYKLKDNYNDQSINDDLIQYEPLSEKMIDDSNKELDQDLQYKINKRGF